MTQIELQLTIQLNTWRPVYQILVARMLIVVNKTASVRANAFLNITVIHTKAVGPSVWLTLTVRRVELVCEINARTLAQVFVHKMLNAEL